jgi:Peptide-N-glycosidase F, C terminal
MRSLHRLAGAALALIAPLPLAAALASGCSSSDTTPPPQPTPDAGDAGMPMPDSGMPDAPADAPDEADAMPPPSACAALGLPERPWDPGPYGTLRHEVAGDFSLPLTDGTTWRFKDQYIGCESYLFVPDSIPVSDLDPTSIWAKDLDALIKKSPKNVHYFFVSRKMTDADAKTSTDAMAMRVATSVGKLKGADADHWKSHLHVVSDRAGKIADWPGKVLNGHGRIGFGVDRFQRVRGFGLLADVTRYDDALNQAMKWPWKANLAYAAHEAIAYEFEVDRQSKLDAENAKIVDLWKGETLAEFAETDVDVPTAAELQKYDTLEVEVDMQCPDPTQIEFGNCGAWDYIASLGVRGDDMVNHEIARFITSYHRETHWVVDASPMLVLLQKGGTQHFRWDFAPSWNTQPTMTKLSLRLSNQKKGYRPTDATFLWSGGHFDSKYDSLHATQMVPIPAGAKRVELWTILTGHGGDAVTQCAEFCDHQHQFTINGKMYLKDFPMAGTQSKCMPEMSNGMVPNQGGTWWFGRGGWCPGEQVTPWVQDVTADVTPGQTATLDYKGMFKNMTPPDQSSDIDLTSYLVVYK